MEYYDYLVPEIGYFMYRKCTPSWKIDESLISFVDITYVIEGSAEYTVNGVTFRVKAGDLLCIPVSSVRKAVSVPSDLMSCFSVNFQLVNVINESPMIPFPLVSPIGIHGDIISLFREMFDVWLRKEQGYFMKCRGLFLLILQKLFELIVFKNDPNTVDFRIKKSIRYITEHYAEDLTLQFMAEQYGLNPVYFGALFKKETGTSMRNFLMEIRMNHAEVMLKSGEYSISETAELCGYTDVVYFRKLFKLIKGIAPSQCKRLAYF